MRGECQLHHLSADEATITCRLTYHLLPLACHSGTDQFAGWVQDTEVIHDMYRDVVQRLLPALVQLPVLPRMPKEALWTLLRYTRSDLMTDVHTLRNRFFFC